MFRNSFCVVCSVILMWWFCSSIFCQGTGKMKNRLSISAEEKLRLLVYNEGRKTAIAESGAYKGFEILIVPKEISETYAKEKLAVLVLLQQIVIGARAKDALLAGGYALSLAQDPRNGALLSLYKESDFDSVIENQDITYRQFLANKIQDCIGKQTPK